MKTSCSWLFTKQLIPCKFVLHWSTECTIKKQWKCLEKPFTGTELPVFEQKSMTVTSLVRRHCLFSRSTAPICLTPQNEIFKAKCSYILKPSSWCDFIRRLWLSLNTVSTCESLQFLMRHGMIVTINPCERKTRVQQFTVTSPGVAEI